MGAEGAAMAVADRVEEVAALAVEMTVTVMAAATNTAADTTAETTVAATAAQDTTQESTEGQATEEQATATAQDTAQEETVFGGGASESQIWDQSRVFDPGTLESF